MEKNLTKLAKIFSIFFFLVAVFHISVELLPKKPVLYTVVSNVVLPENTRELSIDNEPSFSVFVKPIHETVVLDPSFYQLKVSQIDYFKLQSNDSVYIYFSPIKHQVRGYVYRQMPDFEELIKSKDSKFIFTFENLGIPLCVLILSVLTYLTGKIEVKLALFLFNVVFVTVLQWFI